MDPNYIVMIAGMTLVTYIPRYLPLAVLTRVDIPEIVIDWLRFIPVAILASLLVPGVLMMEGRLVLTYQNIYLLASIPTLLIAIYRRNIFLTILTGVLAVTFFHYLV